MGAIRGSVVRVPAQGLRAWGSRSHRSSRSREEGAGPARPFLGNGLLLSLHALPAFPLGTLRVPTRLSSAAAVLRLLQILAALHSSWLGRGLCSGGAWHEGAPGPGRGIRGPACHTASGPLCTLRSNACGGFPDALGPLSRWPDKKLPRSGPKNFLLAGGGGACARRLLPLDKLDTLLFRVLVRQHKVLGKHYPASFTTSF